MLQRALVSLSAFLTLSAVTAADNVISEWGGAQGGYVIYGGEQAEVVINAPGTYKFQALDPEGPYGLGIINHITVDASCPSGTVTVSVVRNPSEVGGATKEPGVNELKEINLNRGGWPPDPNVTGIIDKVYTAGNLGERGDTWATNVADTMVVGTSTPGGADILSNITIDHLDGGIACHTLGSLSITHDGYNNTGSVLVMGDWYEGGIDVHGSLAAIEMQGFAAGYGEIHIAGNLAQAYFDWIMATTLKVGTSGYGNLGYLDVYGHSGKVIVNGSIGEVHVNGTAPDTWWDPYNPSLISATGDITSGMTVTYGHGGALNVSGSLGGVQIGDLMDGSIYAGQCPGPIAIGGHLRGSITVNDDLTGRIIVGGDMTGSIQINGGLGSLENPITDLSGGYIIVDGSFVAPAEIEMNWLDPNTTAFIAIDYDGWHAGHDWGSGIPGDANNACVTVWSANPPHMYANTPAMHVWKISRCKADMNGDGVVSFADINAFVEAEGNLAAYALTYPGLGGVAPNPGIGGSAVFHGDLTCDGVFSFADINAFNRRVADGCCSPLCGPCALPLEQPLAPQQLAIQLMLHIQPELYSGLVDIVDQAARGLDNAADRIYWRAVHRYLTQ